ncbi:hypothetical protein [Poriferisphaera sp. WC338]|uniref:hypothetical protein n=1 Tax=Poriferisphaera sp. WC338 TaxID=3425129 RepID=UPI003D81B37C
MAWTSMHFAMGMIGGGVIGGAACLILRRGWRWLPAAMTAGGIWGLIPDLPRIWREDFTGLPFASYLGSKNFERWLHEIGDVFFFHSRLDAQPKEFALHGLATIIFLYCCCMVMLMYLESKSRNSIANRAWHSHKHHLPKDKRDKPIIFEEVSIPQMADAPPEGSIVYVDEEAHHTSTPGSELVKSVRALEQQIYQSEQDDLVIAEKTDKEEGVVGRIISGHLNKSG